MMVKILPVWILLFIPGSLLTNVNTLFVNQGTTMNRHMGPHFEIPAGSITTFYALSMVVSMVIYDKVLVRIFRRLTGNHRGITILQRMGIGIFLNMVCMVVASIIDVKRISVVKEHGLEGDSKGVSPLTVFILLPQFMMGGISEAFLESARIEFFYDQAPESMQSIGTALYATTIGVGSFLNTFLLNVTTKISGRKGHTSWILNNLNASHIYYYYAFLAILSFINFILFLVISQLYVYKRETNKAFSNHNHAHPSTVILELHEPPMDIKGGGDDS